MKWGCYIGLELRPLLQDQDQQLTVLLKVKTGEMESLVLRSQDRLIYRILAGGYSMVIARVSVVFRVRVSITVITDGRSPS